MKYGKPIRYLVTIQPVYEDYGDDIDAEFYTEKPVTSSCGH